MKKALTIILFIVAVIIASSILSVLLGWIWRLITVAAAAVLVVYLFRLWQEKRRH